MMRNYGAHAKTVRNAVLAVIAALAFLFAVFVFTACEDKKSPKPQKPNEYAITVSPCENGTVTASAQKAEAGATVTLTVTPDNGYTLQSLAYNDNDITVSKSFVMPDEAVTVTAVFSAVEYNVSVGSCENGDVSVSAVKATVGTEITVTATPDDGYRLVGVTYSYDNKDYDITSALKFNMPAAAVTVSAEFERLYAVEIDSEIAHGTVTADKVKAAQGETITLTVTPENEYALRALKVNGVDIDVSSEPYTFTMPNANVTITAEFSTAHAITVVAENGSLTVPQKATEGKKVTVTAKPDKGYRLSALKYTDGQGDHEIDISGALSFTMPNENVTVTATFTAITYNVIITTPVHGSVTASATSGIIGDEITLTVSADTGYELATLAANGTDIKTDKKFTIDAEDVTVTATFTAITYNVTITTPEHGSVTPSAISGHIGDEITLTVSADTGYELATLTANGADIKSAKKFTIGSEDVTVVATFSAINYNVTITTPEHGSVTASANSGIIGDEITLTITADSGYELATLTANGADIKTTKKFTIGSEDVTVVATFTAIPYNVTITTPEHGSVTPSATSGIIGDEITLTIAADTGYELKTLTANGEDILSAKKFDMPAADVTVVATFGLVDYSINVAGGITGGTVVLDASTANMGDTVSFTVTPDSGYGATAIKYSYVDDGETVDVYLYDERTFTVPASNVTVSVAFKPIIKITDAAGFAAIANDLGGYYVLDRNISFEGASAPIGTAPLADATGAAAADGRSYTFDKSGTVRQGEAFTGVFDGQGYIIIGYKQNGIAHAPENYYHGIFGYIGEGATVGNFTLRETTVNGGKLSALISGVNLGKIENVVVESDSKVHVFYSLVGCAAAYNGGTINNVVCYIEKGTSNYGDTTFSAQNLVYESAEGASANNLYVLPNGDVSEALGDGWFYHELVGTVYGNDAYAKYISSSATATVGETFDVTVYRKNPDNGDLSFYVWSGLNIGNPFVYVGYDAATHTYHEKLNTAHDFVSKESISFGINIGGYICSARTIAIAPYITSNGFGDPKSADDAYTGTTTNKLINLVDGDPNSGVAFNTNGVAGGVYIEVDLTKTVEIEKLRVVLGRTNRNGEFVNGFAGHVELIGADGTTTLNLGKFGDTDTDFVATLLPSEPFEARYVRIYMDTAHSGWSALSELYINDLAGYTTPVITTHKFGNPASVSGFPNAAKKSSIIDGKSEVFTAFEKTDREAGGYVQIDLLQNVSVYYLRVLVGRLNTEGAIVDTFTGEVRYSTDGVNYSALGSFTANNPEFAISMLAGEEITMRYVRVVMTTVPNGWSGIREVFINNIGDYDKPVVSADNFGNLYSNTVYANMYDDNDQTYAWFTRPDTAGGHLRFDFLEVKRITVLRIKLGLPNGKDVVKGHVEYSADGATYISLGMFNETDSLFRTAFNARYIRIVVDSASSYMAIREVDINDQVDLSDRTYPIVSSIGFSDVHSGGFQNLFDGDDSTECWFNQRPGADGYILIELLDTVSIESLRIVNGNANGGDKIKGIVEVSADGENFTQIGELNGTDRTVGITLDSALVVRYIRIKNNGTTTWAALCEITVNPVAANPET